MVRNCVVADSEIDSGGGVISSFNLLHLFFSWVFTQCRFDLKKKLDDALSVYYSFSSPKKLPGWLLFRCI
jgi:hypothetical protein